MLTHDTAITPNNGGMALSTRLSASTGDGISIYPNPSSTGYVTLAMGKLPAGTYTVHLIGFSRQKLIRFVHIPNSNERFKTDLPAGHYYVVIKDATGKKFVRQLQIR